MRESNFRWEKNIFLFLPILHKHCVFQLMLFFLLLLELLLLPVLVCCFCLSVIAPWIIARTNVLFLSELLLLELLLGLMCCFSNSFCFLNYLLVLVRCFHLLLLSQIKWFCLIICTIHVTYFDLIFPLLFFHLLELYILILFELL